MERIFQGHTVIPGTAQAPALVSHGGFNTLASMKNMKKGKNICADQNNPDLYKKSLVGVALGVMLLTRPFSAVEAVFMLIGGVFLYLGCSDLWSLYKVSRLTRELRKRAPIDVDPIDID